jgi:hypothetical protein
MNYESGVGVKLKFRLNILELRSATGPNLDGLLSFYGDHVEKYSR